jgi:predicted permease
LRSHISMCHILLGKFSPAIAMNALRSFLSRFLGLFRKDDRDADLAAELESHLAFHIDDNLRAGMSPAEARRQALLKLGGLDQAKESYRDRRGFPWLDSLAQDVRFALRILRKNPGFTATAVLTLALGIGVNTTLFNAYNAIALKPLPIANPGRVVRFERWFKHLTLGDIQYAFSYQEFAYCRDHNHNFSSLIAASWPVSVQGVLPSSTMQRNLTGELVSANYFDDLGIRPSLGRPFNSGEDQTPGANNVIVISYAFWRNAFQNRPQAIGQSITLNGVPFSIVGVAPRQFTGTSINPQIPDFWAPFSMQAQLVPGQDWLHQPTRRFFQILARLKPSSSRLSAQPEANLLIEQFSSTYIEVNPTTAVTLQRTTYFPNMDDIRFRALAAALMLVVGLILFVACVNVGNMIVARGAVRQREISTRRALGATRSRVVGQFVVESILLSLFGGVAGLMISFWSTDLLATFLQRNASLIGVDLSAVNLAPDWRVAVYSLAISLGAGTLLGLSPALQLTREDLAAALKNETGSIRAFRGSHVRNFLISAQVAASVLLLAISGLLTRGLVRSQTADPGFDTRDAFVLSGDLGSLGSTPAKIFASQIALLDQLQSQQQFANVALGTVPLAGTWTVPIQAGQAQSRTLISAASNTYLGLLDIPLVRGRDFTREESDLGAPVAIISESLARSFWPNEDPLGKTFLLDMTYSGADLQTFQVIGVVKDVRFANLTRVDPARVYLPVAAAAGKAPIGLLMRLEGDRQSALAGAQTVVGSFEKRPSPDLQLLNLDEKFVSLERTVSRSLAVFAGILAALALSLAGVGIYGILNYLVSQRTKEIGVRIALGASPRALLKNIAVVGLRPVFLGLLTGMLIAAALSTVMHQTLVFPGSMDLLYGVPFYDPATFAALFVFVTAIAAVASIVPARRAIRIDPVSAMRCE